MLKVILTILIFVLLSGTVLAEQDLIVIGSDGVGQEVKEDGTLGPFEIGDIEVLGVRTPPRQPGFCVIDEHFILWWNGEAWSICWDDEFDPIETPTLSVLLGGKLAIGEFISTDNTHTVEAVIDNVERVEQWSGTDQNGSSGILDFDPKTAKEPTVVFKVTKASGGRTKELSWVINAKIGPLTAQSSSFKQDNLHQLRQEYVDMNKDKTPSVNDFDQSAAAYTKLLDKPKDVHSHHKHWILDTVNTKARAVVAAYTNGTITFTSGYRCPVKNHSVGGGAESQHMYGVAIDFKVENGVDSIKSRMTWEAYEKGRALVPRPSGHYLYDQNVKQIPTSKRPYGKPPNYPKGVTKYTLAHLDWR